VYSTNKHVVHSIYKQYNCARAGIAEHVDDLTLPFEPKVNQALHKHSLSVPIFNTLYRLRLGLIVPGLACG